MAAATAPGRGAVAIVRISGAAAPQIARSLLGRAPQPRVATAGIFRDGNGRALDSGLALYFPAPSSYTGEHVLELQGHGGPVSVEALIRRALELGCRRARPGEFTQRAYLNGKLDLAQAEAVADLIDASSEAAAHAALRSLAGEFSTRVRQLAESLAFIRAYVEATIDFSDEDIDFLSDRTLAGRLTDASAQLEALLASSRQGRLLTEGMTVVIAGPPNAGKSTLLNCLAGHEAAIVTPLPGTTRDLLRERIHLDGMPLHLIDTAGLRLAGDEIEAEGIRRAEAQMARADRILFVIDAVQDPQALAFDAQRARLPPAVPVTLLFNKADLVSGKKADLIGGGADSVADSLARQERTAAAGLAVDGAPLRLTLSAKTGAGVDRLRQHLKTCVGFQDAASGLLSARARHVEALQQVRRHVDSAGAALAQRRGAELIAEDLRLAQRVLGEITGEYTTEDLLGRIFASFCIGK
ncbi:MAG: tRNA uridine-5-carboxymethylaminomethyl(34) synthesis GTPase MnmE [Steroidobacterales bacterium]